MTKNAAPQGPVQATSGNDDGSERVSSQAPNAPADAAPINLRALMDKARADWWEETIGPKVWRDVYERLLA